MNRLILLSFIAVLCACASQMVNPFINMTPSIQPLYGYAPEYPIRIGYSKDIQKNIKFCYDYMAGLRTSDHRPLKILGRESMKDPKNEPKNQGFLGLPQRWGMALGGILDKYSLIAEGGTDTLFIYFDIYHKESLSIPLGLNFVMPGP